MKSKKQWNLPWRAKAPMGSRARPVKSDLGHCRCCVAAEPGWVPSNLIHSPILNEALTYSHDSSRHFIRQAMDIDRDAIFEDLYGLLETAPS